MRFPRPSFLALGLGLLLASCTDAASDPGGDPASAGGSGGAAASSGAGGENTAGTSSGAAGQGAAGGDAGAGGSEAGASGEAGSSGSAGSEAGGAAGEGGEAGAGGEPFGGAAGQSGAAGQPGGNGGAAGSAGGGEPFGGSAGSGGDGGSAAGQSGSSGTGGSDAGAGGSSGTGGSGSGAAPGWTCGEATYKSGGSYPACNCDCGAYDPDCDDPFSHVKGCDKGQTCSKEGTCQGEIAKVPSSWVCGSAYYAIGGPKPVCDCGCGAPDPDCEQPYPTYNLTKCKTGQTCGADGTCQGPELAVPATWTCNPSKFAEGKTSGTCDCDCGAYDPDCDDIHLKLLGCGYKQTCDASGKCAGEIAPAPSGWTCASNTYSDGKLCHCEVCGVRDPDCDLDLPDDCGPDAFCGSIKNECIPKAQ